MEPDYNVAREVLRSQGAPRLPFSVATIGRLQQFLLLEQCGKLCDDFGLDRAASWCGQPFGEYGEPFRAMGAEEIVSIDPSDYEGADVIHDMNVLVPPELCTRFDVVVDGGTMEHVFNPSSALANMLRMVRVGGSPITWSPANNSCGHGVYHFSPEFCCSALNDKPDFDLRHVSVLECVFPNVSLAAPRRAFLVRSPHEAKRCIAVMSRRPLTLLSRSVKTAHRDMPFSQLPQQSDYVAAWQGGTTEASWAGPAALKLREAMLRRLRRSERGRGAVRWLQGMNERRVHSLRNRRFVTPE